MVAVVRLAGGEVVPATCAAPAERGGRAGGGAGVGGGLVAGAKRLGDAVDEVLAGSVDGAPGDVLI